MLVGNFTLILIRMHPPTLLNHPLHCKATDINSCLEQPFRQMNHMDHHFRYHDSGYGITSNFWDRVFGTLPLQRSQMILLDFSKMQRLYYGIQIALAFHLIIFTKCTISLSIFSFFKSSPVSCDQQLAVCCFSTETMCIQNFLQLFHYK